MGAAQGEQRGAGYSSHSNLRRPREEGRRLRWPDSSAERDRVQEAGEDRSSISHDGDDDGATVTEDNADVENFIETFDNEHFKGMCSRINIDAAEHRLYYDWLRETHNIGHSHVRCDDSTAAQIGFYFVNLFGKAKKSQFKASVEFPLPTTQQWCDVWLRHQQSSAKGNSDIITTRIIQQEYQHAVDVAQVTLDQQRDADDKQPLTAVRICLHLLQHTIGDDVQLAHFLNQERSQQADTDTNHAQDILRLAQHCGDDSLVNIDLLHAVGALICDIGHDVATPTTDVDGPHRC